MTTSALKSKPTKAAVNTGLDASARKEICSELGQVLGDTYMLLVKTHVYHWNVVGPLFIPIHELTEEHYKDLFAATDVLAERIRALGFVTPLSFASMVERADLTEATSAASAEDMVETLVADHEAIVRSVRDIAIKAEKADDFVTHDLLVGRLTFHEKAIWMLRAIVS
ncbi:MAG: DNA starvation/stationary phase protection protein [Alphaproteobacteria bacterium BRH_c36]|nr:MAG: DNA starvation/stationary phase protection protein [Alphaproteobacteria bacterium BRH_c36]